MQRYFAFLRAINVGGHTVKMESMRQQFESLGFTGVETFIASGNVVFTADNRKVTALETLIEDALAKKFGYPIATFIRTPDDLTRIASYQPFPANVFATAAAFNVGFIKAPPDQNSCDRIAALENPLDTFRVDGREIYWLCQVRQSESKFTNAVLEKVLSRPSTLRNVSTIRKMAEKYC